MQSYIALLRGINVGGNNLIKMTDLKSCFEKMNFTEVQTYIQSGNVIFNTEEKNPEVILTTIQNSLSVSFNYQAKIALITNNFLKKVVLNAPENFGTQPEKYRYDVCFVMPPFTAKEVFENTPANPLVDQKFLQNDVVYYQRLIEKASQSHLSKLIQNKIYKEITIRNWNTTCKLLSLSTPSNR